jgi:molybdopterin-synthase adenylyltransferase
MQTQRPRLKMAAPLLRAGGELHVVGSRDVTSIPDPDGAVHRLFELADGSRSTAQLHSELVLDFPRLDEQDVADAVWQLESAGLFETELPVMRILG